MTRQASHYSQVNIDTGVRPSYAQASSPPRPPNRYENKGSTLVAETVLKILDYQKELPNRHLKETFSRDLDKYMKPFHKGFKQKHLPETQLPSVFTHAKKAENLKYEKGGSRRRAYTGREAAEAEEKEKRRYLRAALIDAARQATYRDIRDVETQA